MFHKVTALRRLIAWAMLCGALLLAPQAAYAQSCTLVQGPFDNIAFSGSGDASVAFGSNTTAGDTLIVVAKWFMNTGTMTVSVTSTADTGWGGVSGTLQSITAIRYANVNVQLWSTTAAGGADTVTLHHGAAHAGMVLTIYEASSSCTPQAGTGTTGSSTNPSAGSYTPSANGAFLVAAAAQDDNAGTGTSVTAGTGWTLGFQSGGGSEDSADEYRTQATAGAVTGNFGSSGRSGPWAASVFAVTPSGGGSSSPTGNKARKLCALEITCGG